MFSFIFKFETAFLKKAFNSSAIFWSSYNNLLPSTSCISEPWSYLFEKKAKRLPKKFLVFNKTWI